MGATNTTRARIKELIAENPVQTLLALGNQLGISRERVRQICKNEGLDRQSPYSKRQRPFCTNCAKPLDYRNVYGLCSKHHQEKRFVASRVNFDCENCGKRFQRGKSEAYRKTRPTAIRWCSKKCQGKWLAQHYGFGARE